MANIERLKHLKTILERVRDTAPHRFYWSAWFLGDADPARSTPRINFSDILNPKVETDDFCGTTACILGLAALDPEFNRQGLSIPSLKEVAPPESWEIIYQYDDGSFSTFSTAGAKFFDLSADEAEFLFYGDGDLDAAILCVQWLIEGRSVVDKWNNVYEVKEVVEVFEAEKRLAALESRRQPDQA